MNWTPANAVSLREFLNKNPSFLAVLTQSAPKCEGDSMEASALSGRERQGWDNCIARIKALRSDPVGNATDPNFIEPNIRE